MPEPLPAEAGLASAAEAASGGPCEEGRPVSGAVGCVDSVFVGIAGLCMLDELGGSCTSAVVGVLVNAVDKALLCRTSLVETKSYTLEAPGCEATAGAWW